MLRIDDYRREQGRHIELEKFYYTTYGLSDGQKEWITGIFGKTMGSDDAKSYDLDIHDYMLHHY
jgi:hypothetical protein